MAGGQKAEQITVASQGHIWVTPFDAGLTYPTDPVEEPAAPWIDLGYANEDGVTFTATPNVEDIEAWQSATPVRRLVTARELTLATALEQWNRDSFLAAFGGGVWSESGTAPDVVYRYDPPADQDPLAEFAVMIDAIDGARASRWVAKRCNITEAVETQLVRTGAALLPVTFNALTPSGESRAWYFLTNDAEFAEAA